MSQRDLIWLTHCSIRSYEHRAVGYGVDTPPSSSRIATQQFNLKFSRYATVFREVEDLDPPA